MKLFDRFDVNEKERGNNHWENLKLGMEEENQRMAKAGLGKVQNCVRFYENRLFPKEWVIASIFEVSDNSDLA
jgi:hypothetical protein